jgi:hypothetical protein
MASISNIYPDERSGDVHSIKAGLIASQEILRFVSSLVPLLSVDHCHRRLPIVRKQLWSAGEGK